MIRSKKTTRPIGFLSIFIGMLFFFNPSFGVVDVLPDFIGCLFIYLGLSRISVISRIMAEARTAFLKLLAVCLLKDIAVVVVLGMSTNAERPTSLLIVGFAAAAASIYFAFCAFGSLFDGFYSLCVSNDCASLYTRYRQRSFFGRKGMEYSRTEVTLRATRLFLVLREVVCLLPEFSALTTSEYYDSDLIRLYDYVGAMRVLACGFVLIVGLVWVFYVSRYFLLLSRERGMRAQLGEQAAQHAAAHPETALLRRYGLCFLLLAIGAFLTADFYIDFQNVIPDPLAAAFFLGGILLTDLSPRKKCIAGIAAACFGVVCAISSSRAYYFVTNYSGAEISKTTEAANAHLVLWLTALLELLVFLAFLACLLLCLRSVIVKWAGYLPTHEDLEFEKRRREAYIEEFDRDLLRTFVFGFISALCSFIYDYMKEIPSKGVFRLMEFFWSVDFVMATLFAVMMTVLLGNIHKEIRYRFSLES